MNKFAWLNEYISFRVPELIELQAQRICDVSAVGNEVKISSVDEFKNFVNDVNGGTNYFRTTVYLDSDLSFSGEVIEPIGLNYTYQFFGVFDGQGHVISNLTMNSPSLKYTGLFGYSAGLTIRNVVLDSSCSISSSYNGSSDVHVGGIIGGCQGICNIKNNVNMANVMFSGNIDPRIKLSVLYLGGIAGSISPFFLSSDNQGYIKNCANYGSVIYSGNVTSSNVGGIIGYSSASDLVYTYIQNCLNHGTVIHNGTSDALHIGGIVGQSSITSIENCVSAGKINTNNSTYVGSIVGQIFSNTSVDSCYYTTGVGGYPINGTGKPTNLAGTPYSPSDANLTLINTLNSYSSNDNWNKWLLNKNNATITFKVNDYTSFSLSSHIILIPNIVVNSSDNGGCKFDGWYNDTYFKNFFQPPEVTESITLYGLYGVIFTVTFDTNGENILYIPSKKVVFNSTYGTLPEVNRTGYIFKGWFTSKNESVTSDTIVTNANNHILYARWEEITSNVEIVFSSKDLTKEEVEKIVKKYVGAETTFEIAEFDDNEPDEIRVIIKFADKETAKNFVETIRRGEDDKIKRVCFFSGEVGSLSSLTYPLLFLIAALI